MLKAIITVGISASGKTTWAEEFVRKNRDWININRDDIRFSLTGAKNWGDYKFNKSIERMVTGIQDSMVIHAKAKGKNVIISDTNLNKKFREDNIQYLKNVGYSVEVKDFPVDFMEAVKRDTHRQRSVGYQVIWKQWQQWLDYIERKRYIPNEDLPVAVICDIDGTIADMKGIRSPFEWDKVGLDKPISVVCDMLYGYDALGYQIIIVSGRDGICEQDTRKWLDKNIIPSYELFMRKEGDSRKDSIVKEEIFWDSIANRYNVKAVVDDRPQVLRLWRDLNMKVICVGNPYVEF